MPYYAHSMNSDGHRHELVAHLRAVAEEASQFATPFDAATLAYYAGLWHDIGKFGAGFQTYLQQCEQAPNQRRRGPDHKGAGANLAMQHLPTASLLIQGHHGGLREQGGYKGWLQEKTANGATDEALALARQHIPDLLPTAPLEPPPYLRQRDGRTAAEMYLRFAFSALVDADFLDTERHFNPSRAGHRGGAVPVETLWRRLEASQSDLQSRPASAVNEVRNAVYQHCLDAAELPPGLFRLAVPTGGGKTRSGMSFALRHALKHGMQRVIVAVPFISITEQTASEYRNIFERAEDEAGAVLEHHSLADYDDDEVGDFHAGPNRERLAAENWDAPIVVTTTVQLFESLFGNKTSRVRKLHRLTRSVIILDEAQALPGHLLSPILDALRQLVSHFGASVVLSTATQPAFDTIPAFAALPAADIVPQPARYFEALRRVTYEWRVDQPVTWQQIAAEMNDMTQSLAVVNTRKDAIALLDTLDAADTFHLSTLLCGAHRRAVIDTVKQRLKAGGPCHLISTQVIEAGVDLDFPLVLRALAPLDSVIQAAGRCNREGRVERGRVVIFQPETGGLPLGAYRTATDVTRTLLNEGAIDDPHLPQAARLYFERLFQSTDFDRDGIQALRESFDYPGTAREFKLIQDDTESVVITRYGSDAERRMVSETLDALERGSADGRRLRRRLQPYTVSIRKREAASLRQKGLIREVVTGLGEWMGDYDAVRGIVHADLTAEAMASV